MTCSGLAPPLAISRLTLESRPSYGSRAQQVSGSSTFHLYVVSGFSRTVRTWLVSVKESTFNAETDEAAERKLVPCIH